MTFTRLIMCLLVILFALSSTVAFAQDDVHDQTEAENGQITHLSMGEIAPFEGTLYDQIATAKLLVRLQTADESCSIETEAAVARADVVWQSRYDALDSKLKLAQETSEIKLEARNDTIALQNEQILKSKRAKPVVIFGAGVAVGVGLTVLSAWAMGQAAAASQSN